MKRFIIALFLLLNLSAFAGTVSGSITGPVFKEDNHLTYLGTGKVIYVKQFRLRTTHYIELKDKTILIFKDVSIVGNRNHLLEQMVDIYKSNQDNIFLRAGVKFPEVAK